MIRLLHKRLRIVSFPLIPLFLFSGMTFARGEAGSGSRTITPVTVHDVNTATVTVRYALAGSEEETYTVTLHLIDDDGQVLIETLHEVQGDVGSGVKSGPTKSAVWIYEEEFPEYAEGRNHIVVNAVLQARQTAVINRTSAWEYVAFATVIIATGGLAYLVWTKTYDFSDDTAPLPDPPDRP